VRGNIAYGRENVPLSDIHSSAIIAGADAFISRLPDGYDTKLTLGGTALSQGERQLITIARAVLVNAPILILDEATSSVDTMTEQKIRNAILKITEGRTSFIIAHRLSTIRDSDIIIVINNGQLTESGTHDELMSLDGVYASMYRTQVGLD
jgi:ATP-binding cassette subfamily B protein